MTRRAAFWSLSVGMIAALAACGRKGRLERPPESKDEEKKSSSSQK